IIAVASGKGGVGKSTTAVNIALALAAEGATVGILDADIYGPSIPTMLGIHAKPESKDGKTIEPLMAHGLQVMSVGFLIDAEQPMIWRGPMVSKTLQQIMQDTNWRALDYLIIDLPPGTGDVQLTMAQKIPVTAGIIVTTPQDIALQDAKRGLQMFNKVNIPVLGIVENMSLHTCSQCGHTEAIFGTGGGQRFADQYQVPLLGQLPLVASICEDADRGVPTVAAAVDSELSQRYRAIAREAAARLSLLGRDLARKFPPINIEQG
ncbi:MAG: iron-sulfur cluster carrier protein ApbC, partial [Gammaproteobacteria bacterium]|nr:iron-sulfur cluster carrier protein ApbC [Gammaproteobacteria bacterium]